MVEPMDNIRVKVEDGSKKNYNSTRWKMKNGGKCV